MLNIDPGDQRCAENSSGNFHLAAKELLILPIGFERLTLQRGTHILIRKRKLTVRILCNFHIHTKRLPRKRRPRHIDTPQITAILFMTLGIAARRKWLTPPRDALSFCLCITPSAKGQAETHHHAEVLGPKKLIFAPEQYPGGYCGPNRQTERAFQSN